MALTKRFWSWTAEFMDVDQIEHPDLLALSEYWKTLAGDDVPRQSEIEFKDIAVYSGNCSLVMLRTNPMRGRYRIVGHALVKLLGTDPSGQYIHEVYSNSVSTEIYKSFETAVTERKAIYYKREFQILSKSFGYHRLILPLRAKTEDIDRLLVAIYPTNNKLTEASQWKPLVDELYKLEKSEARFADSWSDSFD